MDHRFNQLLHLKYLAAESAFDIFHIGLEVLVHLNLVANHIAGMQHCSVIPLSYVGSDL